MGWPNDLGAFVAKTFREIGGEPSTVDQYLIWSYKRTTFFEFMIKFELLVEIMPRANLFFSDSPKDRVL